MPLLIFLIFTSGFGLSYLNKIDFFEPLVLEKESLLAQISHFPGVILEKEKNQIVFFNSKKEIVKKISAERLNLDEIFKVSEDVKKWSSIYLYPEIIESPQNIFYFLAADSYSCGQNCHWIFYRFDAIKNRLEIIDKDIFGLAIKFQPSPDSKKLALISNSYGGLCNSGDYFKIIDLISFKKERIEGYIDNTYSAFFIDSLFWKNNQEVEFAVYYKTCPKPTALKKVWLYNIEERKLKELESKLIKDSS